MGQNKIPGTKDFSMCLVLAIQLLGYPVLTHKVPIATLFFLCVPFVSWCAHVTISLDLQIFWDKCLGLTCVKSLRPSSFFYFNIFNWPLHFSTVLDPETLARIKPSRHPLRLLLDWEISRPNTSPTRCSSLFKATCSSKINDRKIKLEGILLRASRVDSEKNRNYIYIICWYILIYLTQEYISISVDYNCQLINNPLKHRLTWLSPTRLPSTCRVGPFHVAPGATSPTVVTSHVTSPLALASCQCSLARLMGAWWARISNEQSTHTWDSLRQWVSLSIHINWDEIEYVVKSNSVFSCFFPWLFSVERPTTRQREQLSFHTIRPDWIQSGKAIRFSILVGMHPGTSHGPCHQNRCKIHNFQG